MKCWEKNGTVSSRNLVYVSRRAGPLRPGHAGSRAALQLITGQPAGEAAGTLTRPAIGTALYRLLVQLASSFYSLFSFSPPLLTLRTATSEDPD